MRNRGFTLVELLVGIVILAILMVLALPNYREFMTNSRIRSVAGSIADGIRLAQVEAIRRNRNITFSIDPEVGWEIRDPADDSVLQSEPFGEGAGQIVVDPNPADAVKLTWSGIGQFIPGNNPDDGSSVLASVRVTSGSIADPHELRVVADPALGVGIRVCDKKFSATDPVGCPDGLP